MMYNWKHRTSRSTAEVLSIAGSSYLALYLQKAKLPNDMKAGLLSSLRMYAEAPQDYSDDGWFDLLQEYGLLWVTTSTIFLDEPFSTHARIIRGVKRTRNPGHLIFKIVDPETGTEYDEDSTEFIHIFDGLAYTQNRLTPNIELIPQVFHFFSIKANDR